MKSSNLLVSLLLLLGLSACVSYKVSDFQASITLPASQDCYSFNVISGKETRLAAESDECKQKKLHSIWLDSEAYKMLRNDILRNCQISKCKQITGAFDELFLKIDRAAKMIPKE